MLAGCYLFFVESLLKGGVANEKAIDLLFVLKASGYHYLLLSEQSHKTREELAMMLNDAGFRDITPNEIYTTTLASIDWICSKYPNKNKAVMLGGKGMHKTLGEHGFTFTHNNPDWLFMGQNRELGYIDYNEALQSVFNGAYIIQTDGRKIQNRSGVKCLGAGSVTRMLAYASNLEPIDFSRGSKRFMRQVVRYLDVPVENLIMVGTSYNRDIIPCNQYGITTVYVTKGRGMDGFDFNDVVHPDYIVEDFDGLMK